jgi:antitoxin component YwqK of YwqJK toxin-antitoxin module
MFGQIVTFVTDTASVYLSVWDDSTYYPKSVAPNTSWVIYFDPSRTTIASTKIYKTINRYDFKTWYPNGQSKRFELNNDSLPYYQKDVQEWYQNGSSKSCLKTTRDSTVSIYWWPNGQLHYNRKWWGGKNWDHTIGRSDWWHKNGVKYKTELIFPDSAIIQYFHSSGAICAINVFHTDRQATFGSSLHYKQFFCENGRIASTPMYPHLGRQPITYYDSLGKVVALGEWMLDGNIGPYKMWHSNGKLRCEGNYSMGIKYFPIQKVTNYYPTKSGHWTYYNEAGWKEKEEWRQLDGTVTFKEFNEHGDVINSGTWQEEIPAGVIFPKEYQQ